MRNSLLSTLNVLLHLLHSAMKRIDDLLAVLFQIGEAIVMVL
jgi:hypothetical protein